MTIPKGCDAVTMPPDIFRGLRSDLNLTQSELADVLDLTTVTIKRYEAGTSPVPFTVAQYLQRVALDYSPQTKG